jgi:hypothetical protein
VCTSIIHVHFLQVDNIKVSWQAVEESIAIVSALRIPCSTLQPTDWTWVGLNPLAGQVSFPGLCRVLLAPHQKFVAFGGLGMFFEQLFVFIAETEHLRQFPFVGKRLISPSLGEGGLQMKQLAWSAQTSMFHDVLFNLA